MRNMLSVSPARLDFKSSIDLLVGLIEKAKLLQKDRPFKLQEYAKWNEETRACLTRIYGSDSPNVFSIVDISSVDPPWPYMVLGMHNFEGHEKIGEKFAASCLEDRSRKLANCIMALKVKLMESGAE
jgi:hypothetical protein